PAGDGWKIRDYAPPEPFYATLFMRRLKTDKERLAFLRLHRPIAQGVSYSLNGAAFELADQKKFDDARLACDRSAEVAEFQDSLRERAWVALHRGVVLEARGDYAEALKEIDAALAGFRREQLQEGEAVALARRGRVLVKLDRGAEAAKDLDEASGLLDLLAFTSDR